MAIFLSDKTAYDYWLGEVTAPRISRPLLHVPAFRETRASEFAMLSEQLFEMGIEPSPEEPLHLAVPEPRLLYRSKLVRTHLLRVPPPGSFVRVHDDVFIEAPTLALLRTAASRSRGALLKDLLRTLGAFCTCGGETVGCAPLATTGDVHRYLMGARGMRGVRSLMRLLPYALEGAASIRECEVAALLCAPVEMGGRGLPLPVLNHRIVPRASALETVRFADFCWLLFHLILEYDSNRFHTGAQKIGEDAARRTQLQREGFTVVTLTDHQVVRRDEFEDVVATLLDCMGMRSPTDGVEGFATREAQLRREVLGFDWLG